MTCPSSFILHPPNCTLFDPSTCTSIIMYHRARNSGGAVTAPVPNYLSGDRVTDNYTIPS